MKILMISPSNPFPANTGGLVRIVQIFRGLSEFHDVTLIFPFRIGKDDSSQIIVGENVLPIDCRPMSRTQRKKAAFSLWPYHVRLYYSSKLHEAVRQLLGNMQFSMIYCHFIYTLPYVMGSSLPIVIDQQNVDREYWHRKATYHWSQRNIGRYLFARVNQGKTLHFENKYLERVQGIVSVSKKDSELTREFVSNHQTRFIVAPNGVDIQHFSVKSLPADSTSDSLVLGFFGSMDLELNREAAFVLCKEILPRVHNRLTAMNVSFLIIGRNPPQELIRFAESNPDLGITVTGTVDDVQPYLQKIDILVLPLRSGAGTKLRVLEAMAAGVCIVGSEFALVGIDGLELGKHAYKSDGSDEFLEKICFLAHNPVIRRVVAKSASELAVKHYNWERILRKLSDDLVDLHSMTLSSDADGFISKNRTK